MYHTGYTGYLAHEKSKVEIRGRRRHKKEKRSSISSINMKKRNMGTIRYRSPKQDFTSADDLTIEFFNGTLVRLT